MKATRTLQVTIFGNLGSDPDAKTISAKTVTREVYNPLTNDVEARATTTPERKFLVFSIAVNSKNENGDPITHWMASTLCEPR